MACGNEHFYIIENNTDNVKMLAKYNLNIGYTYERVKTEEGVDCHTLIPEGYDNYWSTIIVDGQKYCIFDYQINDKVLQNSKSIGAHGNEKGEPAFLEVGVIGFLGKSRI